MSKTTIAALDAALSHFPEDSIEADELQRLRDMFTSHAGDSIEDASARSLMRATCGNCQESWPAMCMPIEASRAALMGMRFAQCPRCLNTETVYLGG